MEEIAFGKPKSNEELERILNNIPEHADGLRQTIKENFSPKKNRTMDNLDFLTDKIIFYEKNFGDKKLTGILWEIHRLRNDISHGRFESLLYNGENLYEEKTQKKLLLDYLDAMSNPDHSHSLLNGG